MYVSIGVRALCRARGCGCGCGPRCTLTLTRVLIGDDKAERGGKARRRDEMRVEYRVYSLRM